MGPKRIISILMIFLIICILPPTAKAMEVDVIINLKHDDIEYEFQPYDDRKLILDCSVSCSMDGPGSEAQYVEVTLSISMTEDWYSGGHMPRMKFISNGTKNITIELHLPEDVVNGTENLIVITGTWEAEAHDMSVYRTTGSAKHDEVNVTVIRIRNATTSGTIVLKHDFTPRAWLDVFWPYALGLTVIIVGVIVVIILFFRKRKKEMFDLLGKEIG